MSTRDSVDRITAENWRSSSRARCHAGMWMRAHIEADEHGFVGVWGEPGVWGHTVRFDSLEDALAWVNQEPQPFVHLEVYLPAETEPTSSEHG